MLQFLGIIALIILACIILRSLFPKSKKLWLGIAIIVIIVITYQSFPGAWRSFTGNQDTRLQTSQIDELQEEVEHLTSENDELRASLDMKNSENEADAIQILNLVFASNGNTYQPKDGFTFYSDFNCTEKVTGDIKFFTDIYLNEELENGLSIYILRSSQGYVYSIKEPQLEQIG